MSGTGQRARLIARSVPGLGTVLVGHKTPAHVEENVALTRSGPLASEKLKAVLNQLPSA